jgi:hypothetical protein
MSPTLKVRISKNLDTAIGKAARRSKITKGEWVRATLEHSLTEGDVAGDPLKRLEALKGPTADIEQMLDEIEANRD